ncbi:MAG: hypothetical protein ABIH20_06885, partial [Candidatus Diapherotrites archaeon]
PDLFGIPNVEVEENSGVNSNLIDLWDYADDFEDFDYQLDFRIVTETNSALVDCFIELDRYLSCDVEQANSVGSSSVTVEVEDTDGATDLDSFTVSVISSNDRPNLSGIPDVKVDENDGFQNNIIDLFDYSYDNQDSDSELDFVITNQTNSGLIDCFIDSDRYVDCDAPNNDQTGTNTITVRVRDTDGSTDTDTFRVIVIELDTNEDPILSGIPDVEVNENDGVQNNIIDLFPYASDNEDTDSELNFEIVNQTDPDLIFCEIDQDRYIDCDPPRTNDTGTNTITVEVTDRDGATDQDTFRVIVKDNGNGGSNDAPRISGLPDLEIEENSGQRNNLVDLHSYAFDSEDSDSELDFRISNQSNTSLIYCTIDQDRYFECEAPRNDYTGTSTITIEVEDTDGATDSDTFTIEVTAQNSGVCSDIDIVTRTIFIDEDDTETIRFDIINRGDDDFRVFDADVDVTNNSTYLDARDLDFDTLIRENDEGEIEIRLDSSSVSSDKEATVKVRIRGEFDNGRSCSFSDIEESFRVWIDNEGSGGSTSNSCSDIDFKQRTVSMDESDTETFKFDVENNGNDDFRITDVDVYESSSYLSVVDFDDRGTIRDNDDLELEIELRSNSVSSDKTATVYVDIRGEFDDGKTCSFSQIGRESFKVEIENSGSSGSSTSCNDIEIDASDVTIQEDSSRTKIIKIKNDNSRNFEVDNITVSESNSYFNISTINEPERISANDDGELEIKIYTNSVSSDKSGDVEVRVSGEFSNGVNCSGSKITEKFKVTVDNTESGSSNNDDFSGSVKVDFSNNFAILEKGQTKNINVTIKNGLNDRQCFDLSANDTTVFTTSLSSTEVCIAENGTETISMSITGRNSGTDNVKFKAEYDGISKIKFVSVEVLDDGSTTGDRPQISIPDDPADLFRDNEIILTNSGTELRNVTIRALNAPEGVNIEEVYLSRWETGETLGIEVDVEPGFDGVVDITLSISSDSGSIGVPVEFRASEGQGFTGLVGLATTAGMAIGLIIIVVLVILGILSIFSKK